MPAPFDEIFANHCQCLAAVAEGRHEDAFSAITAAIHAFVKDFKNQETAWSLDALVRLVRGRKISPWWRMTRRRRLGRKRQAHDAGALLMLVYRNTANTSVQEKKSACLFLVIMLFKIYFKLNTLHLCKNPSPR